jgi:hypothetical protein
LAFWGTAHTQPFTKLRGWCPGVYHWVRAGHMRLGGGGTVRAMPGRILICKPWVARVTVVLRLPWPLDIRRHPLGGRQKVWLVAACWLGFLRCSIHQQGLFWAAAAVTQPAVLLTTPCVFCVPAFPCRPLFAALFVSSCCFCCFCCLLLLLPACLPQVPFSGATCVHAHLPACVFTHVWTRSHMHTLFDPCPQPVHSWQRIRQGAGVQQTFFEGSVDALGHSTHAAVHQAAWLLPWGVSLGQGWTHAFLGGGGTVQAMPGVGSRHVSPGLPELQLSSASPGALTARSGYNYGPTGAGL